LQIKKVLSKDYPKEDKMTTFTLITKNGATVNVEITEEQAFAFVKAEIEKLQEKLDELNNLDSFEAGEVAVNSLKAKLNRFEADGKLADSYSYDELKKRASGASFTSYLTELGIEKSLHGSADRARQKGQDAIDLAAKYGVTDEALIRESAIEKVGGTKAVWRQAVIDWLFPSQDDEADAQ
jgi:hypothetical protein